MYGATPAGIAAALAAADDGSSVLLVESTIRVGGMLTAGLSHADFHAFDGLTGTFPEFATRVERHYVDTDGKDSPQARDSFRGTFGEYGNNCHGTGHEGPRFGSRHTGEFYAATPPYQIPYGVLVPQTRENLLVPGAVSASHVGFCALRLEPIWASMGQASGHAAHLARVEKLPVQQVPVPR
ncbi:MAG: FAD-dependent oxidoreductase, partial [Pirellulales bacterium]